MNQPINGTSPKTVQPIDDRAVVHQAVRVINVQLAVSIPLSLQRSQAYAAEHRRTIAHVAADARRLHFGGRRRASPADCISAPATRPESSLTRRHLAHHAATSPMTAPSSAPHGFVEPVHRLLECRRRPPFRVTPDSDTEERGEVGGLRLGQRPATPTC